MYPGRNDEMLCSNTLAELEYDGGDGYSAAVEKNDPDQAYDELVREEFEKDYNAVSRIIHKHIFSSKDLVDNLVAYVRKSRKEGYLRG
mgnify:FL=1